MREFDIDCYFDYRSKASLFRAMFVEIGVYKLYFSYENLIAFKKGFDGIYITKKKFKYAEKHKNSVKLDRWNLSSIHIVEQDMLEFMVFRDMLKIPFDDIKKVMKVKIHSYFNYLANASKWKAMYVELGKYKLYFSYRTPVVFETLKDQYITTEKYSQTTSGHKWSARDFLKNKHYVEQKVLKLITLTTLLKLPFEEAKDVADFRCERVHFA